MRIDSIKGLLRALLVSIFLTGALVGGQSSAAAIDRKSYPRFAIRFALYIVPELNANRTFLEQLTPEERAQLGLLNRLLQEKMQTAQDGFRGGEIAELWDRLGLRLEFSDRNEEFILEGENRLRSAKTTSDWNGPIYFNLNILNSDQNDLSFLDVIQITLHELGHKIGPRKNIQAIDSLAAKMRNYLNPYFVRTAPTSLGERFEALSLPYENSRVFFGAITRSFMTFDPRKDLMFWTTNNRGLRWADNGAEVRLINFKPDQTFEGIQRLTAGEIGDFQSYSTVRITEADLISAPDQNSAPVLKMVIESREEIGLDVSAIPRQRLPLIPPIVRYYQYEVPLFSNSSWVGGPWFVPAGQRDSLPQTKGILRGAKVTFEKLGDRKYKIQLSIPVAASIMNPLLKVQSSYLSFYLQEASRRIQDANVLIDYELRIPEQSVSSTLTINEVVDSNQFSYTLTDKVSIPSPARPPAMAPQQERFKYYGSFVRIDQNWKNTRTDGVLNLTTSRPTFSLVVDENFDVKQFQVEWKRGLDVTVPDVYKQAAILADIQTEHFFKGDWQEEKFQEGTIRLKRLIFISKKFGQRARLDSLIDEVELKDNGWRELKSVTINGENLATKLTRSEQDIWAIGGDAAYPGAYERFFTQQHLRIPTDLLEGSSSPPTSPPTAVACEQL